MPNQTKAREEGAEHADYRIGLSPERSANRIPGGPVLEVGATGLGKPAIDSRELDVGFD